LKIIKRLALRVFAPRANLVIQTRSQAILRATFAATRPRYKRSVFESTSLARILSRVRSRARAVEVSNNDYSGHQPSSNPSRVPSPSRAIALVSSHRLFARTTIRSPSTADSLPPAPDDDTARHRTSSARNKRSVALFARALITADALARILADDADVFVDPTRLARGRLDAADARALVARISEAFSF
tara:strand:- start:5820 stop:6383 length:564 start_codon:yes stop_codon:yes gene_type:complete